MNELERAKQIINAVCGKNHPYNIELQSGDEHTDPILRINNCAGVYWIDYNGQKKYQVCEITHHSRILAYPPSEDSTDVGQASLAFDVQLLRALKIAMTEELFAFIKNEYIPGPDYSLNE